MNGWINRTGQIYYYSENEEVVAPDGQTKEDWEIEDGVGGWEGRMVRRLYYGNVKLVEELFIVAECVNI